VLDQRGATGLRAAVGLVTGSQRLECRSAAVAAERQYSSLLLIFLILAAGCLDVNGSAAVLQLMVN
jgi:hypothetical protein